MAHDQINLQTVPSTPTGLTGPDPLSDWQMVIDQTQRDQIAQAMAMQAQMQMWAQAQLAGQQWPQAPTQVGGGPEAMGKGGMGKGSGNGNKPDVPWGILKKMSPEMQQMIMQEGRSGQQMAPGGTPMAGGMQQPLNAQAILTQMGSPLS